MKFLLTLCLTIGLIMPLTAQEKMVCCSADDMTVKSSATTQFAMLSADKKFVDKHENPMPMKYDGSFGSWITYKTSDGKESKGYLVKSEKPTDNYILMIHEWWGLNDYIKREAENLQKELGNVNILALDLYDGNVAATREDAGKFMQSVKEDRAKAIINGAIAYAGPKSKIATIGWCFGGGWSLQAGLLGGKQTVATILYYGMPESNVEKLKTLNGPVLGIFGSKDAWITPEVAKTFESNMKAAGKSVTIKIYDADHAFANPSNPKYDKASTEDAHQAVLALYKEAFKK